VDFGLAGGDPGSGHLRGTPRYLAPEQLDPSRPIDARTDVYALGVLFYELLCGSTPYTGELLVDLDREIREARPRLPVEVEPSVPEPLQAIALKAMEVDPEDRYPSAREMALDLERYLDGRPVLARPTYYSSALGKRLRPHLEQIQEWLRLKLIYPHEAGRLESAYGRLEAREDDWIVESRTLSYSQIALYLGALLLVLGGLLYFVAHRFEESVEGILIPLAVLGLPFAGLTAAGHVLYRREHKAVGVAFALAAVLILPMLLLVVFHEAGLWVAEPGDGSQFFEDGSASNRQLQVSILLAGAWAFVLALRTRTTALSSIFTVLATLLGLAVLTDLGLRTWLEEAQWDRLSIHLVPLLFLMIVLGRSMERGGRPWFARPLYVGSAVLFVVVLELLALDGRAFRYLGLSLSGFQSPDVADPVLLDTLAAMTLIGMALYLVASLLERRGSGAMVPAAFLLFVLSPFATLEPIAYLNHAGDYSRSFAWLYLGLSLAVTLLSHHRQRRSFYLAGLLNTALAIWLITVRYEWWDRPWWAVVVLILGLAVLAAGFQLDRYERALRRIGST
jgi:Protein kinase domain